MKILIPLANGCEEIETITNIDVLRRAGIDVITTSLNNKLVKGAHDIEIKADTSIGEININDFDGILLPGGPGYTNLRDDNRILEAIKKLYENNKLVAAICAAPIVLAKAGVIDKKKATSYPGCDKEMIGCVYSEERVVVDGNIITGRGPGVSIEFALKVVEYLVGDEKVRELKEGLLV